MTWYELLILIVSIIIVIFIIAWLVIGLYSYNVAMVAKEKRTLDNIPKESHWYCFLDELKLRKEYFDSFTSTRHEITNKRGIKLVSYLVRQDKSETPTLVVFAHGYKSNHWFDSLCANNWMLHAGYDALFIDQEGLGESGGKRMGFGLADKENLLEWLDYVNNLYQGKVNIILAGVSMGANTVLMCSDLEIKNVKCIIADCGYTSLNDAIFQISKKRLFTFMVRTFLRLVWRRNIKESTLDKVKNAKYPIMFIHGKSDKFIYPINTIKNYEACSTKKELFLVDGAKHAESGLILPDEYNEKIMNFLKNIEK